MLFAMRSTRMLAVFLGMRGVTVCGMSVVSGLLMVAGGVVLGRFGMMFRCVSMVFRRLCVVLAGLL